MIQRFIILFFISVSLSNAQTHPTGGGAFPSSTSINAILKIIDQIFKEKPKGLDQKISKKILSRIVVCGVAKAPPAKLNIVDVYVLLQEHYIVYGLMNMKSSPHTELNPTCKCEKKSSNNQNLACLIKGSENDIENFADSGSEYYIKSQYHKNSKESHEIIKFFKELNAPSFLLKADH